jgi:two-component system alkaline phosphatase synthesis response regulator PhoP
MKDSILVVDDEEDIRELVRYNLDKGGFSVICGASGEEGLSLAKDTHPAAIVLDIMLPGIDGLEVCRRLKGDADLQNIPIVMLSAKGEEADIVAGLELGADDYVAKPFSPSVLIARVKNVLRRSQQDPVDGQALVAIDGLVVDPARREVLMDSRPIDLTNTEFKLLHFLIRKPGVVYTRGQIVNGVHGDDYPVTDRSVDVQVVGLRKKLGEWGNRIETVRGVGYRFKG